MSSADQVSLITCDTRTNFTHTDTHTHAHTRTIIETLDQRDPRPMSFKESTSLQGCSGLIESGCLTPQKKSHSHDKFTSIDFLFALVD